MGEEGRIEVTAQASFLAEVHPFFEMFGFQLVPVCPAAILKDGIGCMKIHFLGARAQLQYHVQVSHQFLGGSGTARIVAGGLDAAGEGLGGVGVEAPDIVSLPAVQGNGDVLQFGDGSIGINAEGCVSGFCFCVRHII